MSASELSMVLQQSLLTVLSIAGPILVATLVVGLAVSIVQAATQINEATLSFVPKLLVVAGILVVMGPDMAARLISLARLMFQTASEVAR
jgi:flagellar biosynthetic protein FliQ